MDWAARGAPHADALQSVDGVGLVCIVPDSNLGACPIAQWQYRFGAAAVACQNLPYQKRPPGISGSGRRRGTLAGVCRQTSQTEPGALEAVRMDSRG